MQAVRYILCYIATAALMLGILLGSTLIPKTLIKDNVLASAEYFCGGGYYDPYIEGVDSTRIDRYADTLLAGIAYQFNSRDALRSVMEASYYTDPDLTEPESLKAAVEGDLSGNMQYLRYWHGSAAVLRALFVFFSIREIYIWHGLLLGVLFITLIIRLLSRGFNVPAAGLSLGMISVAFWFIPMSLEYTWLFLVLFIQLHILISQSFPTDKGSRCLFFLISAMVTNYLDFLTCELITLLVPLLLILWLDRHERRGGMPWKGLIPFILAWGIGYVGMYLTKWALAAAVLRENVMPLVGGHIEERLVGEAGVSFGMEMWGALTDNIRFLFPMDYGVPGMLAGIGVVLAASYIGFVYRRKDYDRHIVLMYAAIAAVPYFRYLVLINHSYLHAFFTYRAQFAGVFAVVLILSELTGWELKPHGKN